MMLTAIVNSFAMPVIAFFVIKLQFTFYSKKEGNTDWESEAVFILILNASFILLIVAFRAIEKSLFTVMGEKMTREIRIKLIEEILHKQISWFDREDRAPGIITKIMSADVALLNGMTAEVLVTLFELIFVMALGLLGGLWFSWQASIVCMICSPIMLCGMYLQATMKWGKKNGRTKDNTDKVSSYDKSNALLSDVIINYRTVISFGQKNIDELCSKFEEFSKGPMEEVISKSNRAGMYYGLGQAGRTIYISLVFIINIELLVVKWGLDGTEVFTATYLLFFTYMSLGSQAANVPSITRAKQAAVPIFQIMDEPSDLDIRKPAHRSLKVVETGKIEFKDVTFSYPTRAQKVMDNFNLEIPAGAKIALVGHSGCGKSTLTNILLRFYNIKEGDGEILIDGRKLDDYDAHALRDQCGYVQQEPVLFNQSITKNIRFGKPGASDQEVYIAAKKANALEFIEGQEDLTPEEKVEKAKEQLETACAPFKQYPNIQGLASECMNSPHQQLVTDLVNSMDDTLMKKANDNIELLRVSIESISGKYGASWADIVIHFEWHFTKAEISLVNNLPASYQTTIDDPALHGCFDMGTVREAQSNDVSDAPSFALFIQEKLPSYRMTVVRKRYDCLMQMMVDRMLTKDTKEFILHEGFNKECGLKGGKLSGGQKQRIAIARALIKDPRILILDEATSALDEHSQEIVQQALDRSMEGRTSIVIAHRLSTIRNCDILFVLGNGHVLEYGTYDELASDLNSHFSVLKAGMEN